MQQFINIICYAYLFVLKFFFNLIFSIHLKNLYFHIFVLSTQPTKIQNFDVR